MQTFLPYPDFRKSFSCLDYKRLGKQRVESKQIIDAINYIKNNDVFVFDDKYQKFYRRAWINHPCTKMWKENIDALMLYHNLCIDEWVRRGFNNSMKKFDINEINITMPDWFGNEQFHNSHKSNLLRKFPEHYSQFGWNVPDNLPYVWPFKSDIEGWFEVIRNINKETK